MASGPNWDVRSFERPRWAAALGVAIGGVAWTAYLARLLLRSLHVLQLEQYFTWPYVRWVAASRERWAPAGRVWLALAAAALGHLAARRPSPAWPIAWALAGAWGWWRSRPGPAKKPLMLTGRAKRLLVGQASVSALTAGGVAMGLRRSVPGAVVGPLIAGAGAATLLAPATTAAANLLLWPVEAGIRGYYVRDARRRLRASRVNVVAVAGSYGKTSTKQFAAAILSARWPTLTTAGSTNTLMGNARVAREQLRTEHQQFVVELGDWFPRDIRDLCQMLEPRVAIFTTIGPEHLERFKTMERIVQAKAELVDALPPDGLAIVNDDDPLVRSLGERARARGLRVTTYGQRAGVDVRASDVRTTRDGLAFRLHAGGGSAELHVGVLGRHNVSNLLAAAAAGLELGMTLEEVAAAAATIRPVEHRLQPIRGEGGVLVIDDAYNSNPRGAAEALNVLAQMEGARKILVTPGMVELGAREGEENRAFARKAAEVCDEVVLVGHRQAPPLLAGLQDGGFPVERTHLVGSLAEATERLQGMVRSGDVVLFENDLPDQYELPVGGAGLVGAGPSPPSVDGARSTPRTSPAPPGPAAHGEPGPGVRGDGRIRVRVGDLTIAYRQIGPDNGPPVLVLHGWGATSDSVQVIQRCLSDRYRTIAPDLPGFGGSDLPPETWGTAEYAEAIRGFAAGLGVERMQLIGHSRGGAIGIILAARHPELAERLVLVNSAGIRRPLTLRARGRVAAYRAGRKAAEATAGLGGEGGQAAAREWFARRFGSADYRAAGPMRPILVRVVNEDWRDLLPRIMAPTLLIWGEHDLETPLADGRLMERLIPDAGLVVFPGAGHFAYADDPGRFCRVVGHFLRQ